MAEEEPIVEFSTLEREKENITVNRTGHSALALQQTFSVPRSQRQQQLAAAKARFTEQLQIAQDESPDPLDAYVKFVEWTIDSYPSGKSPDSGLVPLLELATRTFKDEPVYKQDLRYLNLWLQYANVVAKPELIFAFLIANDIGQYYSTLYVEYANVLELQGNRTKADEVFRLGIARKAKPLAILQLRYNEFMSRMLTAHPNASTAADPETPAPLAFGSRKVLGERSTGGRSVSGPAAVASSVPASARAGPSGNRGKIAVFVDDGAPAAGRLPTNEWNKLDTQAAIDKENSAETTAWVGERLHQPVAQTPRTPRFAVHKDLDGMETPRAGPSKTPDHLSIRAPSQREQTEAEMLFHEPFKNYSEDPSPPTQTTGSSAGVSSTRPPPPSIPSTSAPPAIIVPPQGSSKFPQPRPFILPTPDPGRKPEKYMFHLNLLWNEAEGKEYTAAEVRARSLGLWNKKWPPPDLSSSGGREYFELTKVAGGSKAGRMSVAREPTVTINTKFAMNDVFDMFNGAGEEEEDSFEVDAGAEEAGEAPLANVPPTPTPFGRSVLAPTFTPFNDRTPGAKPAVTFTPKFTPFTDSASLGHGKPPSMTPGGRSVSGPSALGQSTASATASRGLRFTPFVDPPTKPREPLSSKPISDAEVAGPTPHRSRPGPAFRPFVETADAVEVPPTPTPLSDSRPPRMFDVPSTVIEEPEPSKPRKAPSVAFNIFRDIPTPKGSPATIDNVTTSPGTGPLPVASDNIFSAGTDSAQTPRGLFMQASPSLPAETASNSPPEQPDGGDSDWSEEDDAFHGQEAPPSTDSHDYDEENAEYVEELPEPRNYRLNHFPQIDEMTPITERTYEFTRTSSGFTTTTRLSSGAELASQPIGQTHVAESPAPTRTRPPRASLAPRQSLMPSDEPDEGIPNPCNPYDEDIVSQLIDMLFVPFYDFRDQTFGQLDRLQRFGAKKLKASADKKRPSSGGETISLDIGDDRFEVSEKLGEGGFGSVFRARWDVPVDGEEDTIVAIKAVKPCQLWEYTILTFIRDTVHPDLLPSIIEPKALFAFQDESYLVIDHCEYGTLLDCVNRSAGTDLAAATSDAGWVEVLVVFFTVELFKLVEGLHLHGFIHGDLKIDNCLVRIDDEIATLAPQYEPGGGNGWGLQGIRLIDFGRAIDTNSFPEGQKYIGDWNPEPRDCVEMREGRPWTFEADYFGLAGIIHSMLFKKYIDSKPVTLPDGSVRHRITTPIKRYWSTDLWSRVFDVLLNPRLARPDQSLPIPDELAALRTEMEGWLVANSNSKGLKRMLKKLAVKP